MTCLYNDDVASCIRFNSHDVSALRIDSNATGALIGNRAELTGEYVCHVRRDTKGAEQMTVKIEHRAPASDPAGLVRQSLGVDVIVASHAPAALRP